MKKTVIFSLILISFALQSCTNTFMGSVLVLNFRDIILYVALAFGFSIIIAFMVSAEKRRSAFWLWFVLSLLLTPLAGFIYMLIRLSKRNKE
jgi:hypothetical protein